MSVAVPECREVRGGPLTNRALVGKLLSYCACESLLAPRTQHLVAEDLALAAERTSDFLADLADLALWLELSADRTLVCVERRLVLIGGHSSEIDGERSAGLG